VSTYGSQRFSQVEQPMLPILCPLVAWKYPRGFGSAECFGRCGFTLRPPYLERYSFSDVVSCNAARFLRTTGTVPAGPRSALGLSSSNSAGLLVSSGGRRCAGAGGGVAILPSRTWLSIGIQSARCLDHLAARLPFLEPLCNFGI